MGSYLDLFVQTWQETNILFFLYQIKNFLSFYVRTQQPAHLGSTPLISRRTVDDLPSHTTTQQNPPTRPPKPPQLQRNHDNQEEGSGEFPPQVPPRRKSNFHDNPPSRPPMNPQKGEPPVPVRDDVTDDEDDVTPTGSLERRKDATVMRHPNEKNLNVNFFWLFCFLLCLFYFYDYFVDYFDLLVFSSLVTRKLFIFL